MKRLHQFILCVAAAAVTAAAGAAHAVTITVTPTLAPNAFGSPSFAPWAGNAFTALYNGQASAGAPGTPSYFQAQSNVQAKDLVVTNFSAWMGQAEPGGAFGGEFGNRGHFGLSILGDGAQFSISQLSFSATSTDPGDLLAFGFLTGEYDYSSSYVGVLAGDDGVVGTGDDTFVTSGANTQLVDALFGRGSGNSLAALCGGCTPAQEQAAIDAAAGSFGTQAFKYTGTYQLRAVTGALIAEGSGTFNVGIPEPSTWALSIVGFGFVGGALRRRRTGPALAA
ncbi:MAG TPA: PEPxxWA-CTERM sorting domain-containing protein [Phenylobacterium sp.]|nr:PEPxxWA-CTERM sorting domain-containing protein [Phenylobacterium sp.]